MLERLALNRPGARGRARRRSRWPLVGNLEHRGLGPTPGPFI